MKAKETKKEFGIEPNASVWSRLKNGDTNALGEIYNTYIDILILYGLKIYNDKHRVMDGIHDLFVDLYKYRAKLSATDSIEYYLKASLKRKLHKGQNNKEFCVQSDVLFSHFYSKNNYTKSHEETMILSETLRDRKAKLLKAFECLTAKQRKGLSLRFDEQLSYEEIAKILNISVSSARTTIYRAIKSLRQHPFLLPFLLQIIFF